jgi:serine/threonine protein phosphatase PrpC
MGVSTSASDQAARFVDRLTQVNVDLQGYSQRNGGIIGSTVAALLIFDGEYRCLWLGDSRIYLVRRGRLSQLSRDHSEVQELVEAGVLSREEARTWRGRNVITRAVGVHPEMEIETAQGDVEPGDSFILCSDGLTAHASDDDILDAVTGRRAKDACDILLDLVLERGATDNVTIVIIQVRNTAGTVAMDGENAFAAGQ